MSARSTLVRFVTAALVVGAGAVAAPAPASAATGPAHTFVAAHSHAPTPVNTWVQGAITSAGQHDWYRVVLTHPGYLSVLLGDLPKNYNLAVYDTAGKRLAFSDHGGTHFEDVDLPRAVGADYFVRVASTKGTSTTRYTLRARYSSDSVGVLTPRVGALGRVYADLVNNSASWVYVPLVDLHYYGSTGKLLATDGNAFVVANWVYLAPHQRVPVAISTTQRAVPKGTARVTVTPHPEVVADRTALRMTFTVTSVKTLTGPGSHRRVEYRGTMTNRSSRAAADPTAVLQVRDRRGRLVDLDGHGGDVRSALAPGKSRAFWVVKWDPKPGWTSSIRILESPNT